MLHTAGQVEGIREFMLPGSEGAGLCSQGREALVCRAKLIPKPWKGDIGLKSLLMSPFQGL